MIKGLKDRKFNISSSARRIILSTGAAIIAVATVFSAGFTMTRSVTIKDGDNSKKEVITFKRYVEDVLNAQEIALYDGDKVNVDLKAELEDNMEIEVYRSFPVSVTEKGETREFRTTKHTAGEALNEIGLNVKESDIISPAYGEKISIGQNITLVRTAEDTIEVSEEIPYECKEKINNALASGQQKLVQKGKVGEKKIAYKVSYHDGKEVSREKIGEEVISSPVAQIKEIGPRKKVESYQLASAGTVTTSRSGNLAYSRVISANATAYDASSCGKAPSHPGYGITATGARAVKGVVAVDPSVIPLGSRLYIESADGSYVYGNAVAADKGSAIKGNRIDLCFNTRAEALRFGRKAVKVYILK